MIDLTDPNFELKARATRLAEGWEKDLKRDVGPGKHFVYYHFHEVCQVLGRKIDPRAMLERPGEYIEELRAYG